MPEQDVKAGELNKAKEPFVWYSHRVTRRWKWCIQAKAVPFSTADDSGVACVRPEFNFGAAGWARSIRCGIRQRVFWLSATES